MRDGSSMEAHLKYMKELTDKLAAVGAPISEEDQVVTLLGSLPRGYSTLVTALEARADNLKLNFVQQALIHEELKLKGLNSAGHSGSNNRDKALQVGVKNKLSKSALKCYKCGEAGHFMRN
jgi:hypothetical protein